MANLRDLVVLEKTEGLKERVQGACWRMAKTIFAEADMVANHENRIDWSVRVLRANGSESTVILEMLRAVITVKESGDISDQEIEEIVATVVNRFARSGV